MLKWIKNSKGESRNKSTGFKGIKLSPAGKYVSLVVVKNKGVYKDSKQYNLYVGTYNTLKEAKEKRVEYILSLF
jgi:hypothetical protein